MLQLSKEDGQAAPVAIRREDYTAPAYWIDSVELTFDLDPAKTRVLNRMTLRRNADVPAQPLRLHGEDLNLARVLVNGQGASFKIDGGQLVLDNLSLADALPLINRYLDSPLSLADSATGKLRIGGVFNTRQIDRLVSSLPKVLPVYLSRNAEGRTVLGTRPAL